MTTACGTNNNHCSNLTTLTPPYKNELKLNPEFSELFANLSWEQEVALCPAILDEIRTRTDQPQNHKTLRQGYEDDEWWMKIRDEMLKPHGIPHSKEVPLSECTINDGRLYFRERLYVPEVRIADPYTQLAHDTVESGHPGKISYTNSSHAPICGQN